MLLSSSQSITQNLNAIAAQVCEVSTHELKSNLTFVLTLDISKQGVVQSPDFGKMLLSLSQSTTLNLDALAVVVHEISTNKLRSNLAIFVTLSISTPFVFQT